MGRDMGRGQDKGGVYVQLSYEAKKQEKKLRCLGLLKT